MYILTRERDGAGDSGSVSDIFYEENDEVKREHNARPRVGVQIQVGSRTARTMSWQDYWHTTFITEILVDEENYVKFKTGNSIYEWKIA